ncbi:hypothetical protein [Larkinella soli]|uniref:hypothetical protein n=1 Tax=Larkinella soli TaxID=1770527 RepID=UPI000FFB30B6|nr:hypothetical protein [Larkinella soli]
MKAYNETWVRNKRILEQATRWERQGLLDASQMAGIRERFPVGFHDANGFIEIGLFIFTVVAVSGSYFLLATLLSALLEKTILYHLFNLTFGLAVGLLANRLITTRRFYRSGVDNALILVTVALIAAGLAGLLPDSLPTWAYCLAMLPVLLLGVAYYADLLLTLAAYGTLVTTLVDLLLDVPGGHHFLPFVGMALATGLYMLARRYENDERLLYWKDNIILSEWLSISLLLISCNYFIVRQIYFWRMENRPPEPPEIPAAWLYWALTFLVPLLLFYIGIRQKERPLLIMSAIGWGIALTTWRYYHALLSTEAYLTLNGLILMALAIALIRYLRRPQNGFTDRPDEDSPKQFLIDPETMATIQATTGRPGPKGMPFGGGDFGGGGSGDRY